VIYTCRFFPRGTDEPALVTWIRDVYDILRHLDSHFYSAANIYVDWQGGENVRVDFDLKAA
jgi:hypothetical protein